MHAYKTNENESLENMDMQAQIQVTNDSIMSRDDTQN